MRGGNDGQCSCLITREFVIGVRAARHGDGISSRWRVDLGRGDGDGKQSENRARLAGFEAGINNRQNRVWLAEHPGNIPGGHGQRGLLDREGLAGAGGKIIWVGDRNCGHRDRSGTVDRYFASGNLGGAARDGKHERETGIRRRDRGERREAVGFVAYRGEIDILDRGFHRQRDLRRRQDKVIVVIRAPRQQQRINTDRAGGRGGRREHGEGVKILDRVPGDKALKLENDQSREIRVWQSIGAGRRGACDRGDDELRLLDRKRLLRIDLCRKIVFIARLRSFNRGETRPRDADQIAKDGCVKIVDDGKSHRQPRGSLRADLERSITICFSGERAELDRLLYFTKLDRTDIDTGTLRTRRPALVEVRRALRETRAVVDGGAVRPEAMSGGRAAVIAQRLEPSRFIQDVRRPQPVRSILIGHDAAHEVVPQTAGQAGGRCQIRPGPR